MEALNDVSTRIAALLLLDQGELSLSDIEAIPFVEDPEAALAIALKLQQSFDVETCQQKRTEGNINFWEDVIRLRRPIEVERTP